MAETVHMGNCTCGKGKLQRTGLVTLSMPIRHQRKCSVCGTVVWCIPENWGESFRIISTGDSHE